MNKKRANHRLWFGLETGSKWLFSPLTIYHSNGSSLTFDVSPRGNRQQLVKKQTEEKTTIAPANEHQVNDQLLQIPLL